jgi:ectoine hydroxylase-related dioxygenase (phytanoyl-CoA dioxygenase family)
MVAVDPSNESNGCLQVASGVWNKSSTVPLTSTGVITRDAENSMSFVNVQCDPGDVVFFNGYIPHRSNANTSATTRRALFLTYNPKSQGDHHADYYLAKHAGRRGFDGAKAISFQGDFQGKIID